MLMRKCLLAMVMLMLVSLMLLRIVLNLKTSYADIVADLCIRFFFLMLYVKKMQNNLNKSY